MIDELPPLPMKSLLYETRDRFDDPLHINGYTADQMQAYARAAIEKERERQSVPAGYVLVPVEPTKVMKKAGMRVQRYDKYNADEFMPDRVYTAMLAAAPQPQPVRCTYCDGTGDVHSITGEWRGSCGCEACKAQPQPVQEPVAWSERIKELADQYAIECVEFSKGIPNGAHSMSPIAVKAGDTRLALHSAIDTAERFIRAIEYATLAAQVERATQPQQVQEPTPLFQPGGAGVFLENPQAQPLSDEQIQEAVTQAVKDGNLSWLGFKKDGMGIYTVPDLSPAHYQLARAIEQAHGITKGTT